ncbi:FGGY-family carbohydrate kinase [Specibacter sp. NPDC078692]|uniref:rhamnulokinase n=1 Tax=Specibacter sp. NPDC078692 TaxID=3155818 RepID=UPI0034297F69
MSGFETTAIPTHPAHAAHAAIDLGASSGRVMLGLLTANGLELEEVHRFSNEPIMDAGYLSWDIDKLFSESLKGLERAVARCAETGSALSSIGVDSWGVDFAVLERNNPRIRALRHHRGAADPASQIKVRGLNTESVYGISGVPDQAINSSFRLSELNARKPFDHEKLLFVPDLWVYLLTGSMGTEPTIASTSQLMDPSTDEWSQELIAAHGLVDLDFPQINAPGTFAALTTSEITEHIGASAAVPVYRVASHDTASAFAFATSQRSAHDTEGLISSGTWSLVGVAVDEPVKTPAALEAQFTNERGVDGILLLRNLNGMWILQECLRDWAREDGVTPELVPLLALAEAAEGNTVVFDVADDRLLAPGQMAERIGVLCQEVGRPQPTSRGETVRCILDSLAAAYGVALKSAEAVTGTSMTSLRIVGGGSKNALLCQLTANLTGLIVVAGPAEASSIGNIAVQAVATGSCTSIAEVYATLHGAGTETSTFFPARESSPIVPALEGIHE